MVWAQWRSIQVETAERARTQSAWILTGALDWARLILREDARNGGPDHLGEPWAVPLAEARLSSFLAADKNNNADDDAGGPEAFLSGAIADAQSRYNLRNLVQEGKVVPEELRILQRLCEIAGLSAEIGTQIAEGLRNSWSGSTEGAAVAPQTVDQLVWLGVQPADLDRLKAWIVLLPEHTAVNINTAPREVLAAVVEGLDLGSAERIVQARQRDPFNKLEDAKSLLPSGVETGTQRLDVRSNFFEVTGQVRLGDRVLQERSLVQRRGLDIVALRRERVSLYAGASP
jgi:general secretion pathway protein K